MVSQSKLSAKEIDVLARHIVRSVLCILLALSHEDNLKGKDNADGEGDDNKHK